MTEEPRKARWETYADEIVGKDDAQMEAAVAEYAKNRHTTSSSQNEDELARWREGNREIAKEYQWVKPEEYADIGPRIGRVLTHEQFINILRDKCKLHCFYREMGHPQKIALWVKRNGISEPESVGWCQRPYMIEYEVVRFDERGVPLDSRYRGYRTVLLNLLMKGMLTEQQITKAFGPATGPASGRYNKMLYELRKQGLGLK
jgi:hypothetical protein